MVVNPNTTYLWFFRGPVRFVGQGLFNAKYSLTSNGAIIKVKNSGHVRMVPQQYGMFPDSFEIIAPMAAVKAVIGKVPDEYMHHLPASEYLRLREVYQGF